MYSLKGLVILENTVEKAKRSVFAEIIQSDGMTELESNMMGLKATYSSKDSHKCKDSYKICLEESVEVHVLYKEFTDRSAAMLGMVWHLETLLKLLIILKNLISAYREKNWKDNLQAIQDMITFFVKREV